MKRTGFAKLTGPRSGRDVTRAEPAVKQREASPSPQWTPPKQPVGNPRRRRAA